MTKPAKSIRSTELGEGALVALRRVRSSKQPLVITQRGRPTAILLSLDAFHKAERERAILRLLASGEREIARGVGHDLDSVMADADKLLRAKRVDRSLHAFRSRPIPQRCRFHPTG